MPTDEQAVALKEAYENEKAGYELRLKSAEGDEAENLKARVKAVDDAIDALLPKKKTTAKTTSSKKSTSTKKKES